MGDDTRRSGGFDWRFVVPTLAGIAGAFAGSVFGTATAALGLFVGARMGW